jgi:hypothetical protein
VRRVIENPAFNDALATVECARAALAESSNGRTAAMSDESGLVAHAAETVAGDQSAAVSA